MLPSNHRIEEIIIGTRVMYGAYTRGVVTMSIGGSEESMDLFDAYIKESLRSKSTSGFDDFDVWDQSLKKLRLESAVELLDKIMGKETREKYMQWAIDSMR